MKTPVADRLKIIMKEHGLRQIDILKRAEPYCKKYGTKLGRNDLSQYVSGKVSPGQEKLTVLALALEVSEAWLMGYDVPMESRRPHHTAQGGQANMAGLSPDAYGYDEHALLLDYRKLSRSGKEEAVKRIHELTLIPDYIDNRAAFSKSRRIKPYLEPAAAHDRTDIEVTDAMRSYDNALMDNDELWNK